MFFEFALNKMCLDDFPGQDFVSRADGIGTVQYLESFTMSKTDCHLLCQKVRQRILVMKKTLVFLLSSRQKVEQTANSLETWIMFDFITEILK